MKETRYYIFRLNGQDFAVTTDAKECLEIHNKLMGMTHIVHAKSEVKMLTTTYSYRTV